MKSESRDGQAFGLVPKALNIPSPEVEEGRRGGRGRTEGRSQREADQTERL